MKFTFQPESRPLDGYTLKRGIARGGFGEVYYALSDAGKEVAVKLLQHNLDVELRGVQQCLNLRHPNLVTIFDVRTDADNDHWVVMEYIGGQTLEQVLHANPGALPLDQIERWLNGLTGGLSYLHDRGIVHRDVKPGNVFWDQGSVKIGDIGLSKFMTPSRRSAHTESVGTVYYMAPEVSYGKYGYEVDVYSVGIMLYEMLTGKLPFDGQSTGEILMKHLSEPPDLSIVPAAFRPMLISALEKDPKKRTGSMTKLQSDFQQARRGGVVPVSESRPSGFAKWIPPVNLPVNLPEPGVPAAASVAMAGAMAGAMPINHPLPPALPVKYGSVSWPAAWFLRGLFFVGCYLFLARFVGRYDEGRGPDPFELLMCWPLFFTALRTMPMFRDEDGGYRPLSLEPLARHLERYWGAGEQLRILRGWTQSTLGYWAVWTGFYLLLQMPLMTLANLHVGSSDLGGAGTGMLYLMYAIYTIPLFLERRKLAYENEQRRAVERGQREAEAAARTAQARPAPAMPHVGRDAGRGAKPGYRPAPPPLPAAVRSNLRFAELARSMNWATILTLLFAAGTGFLSPLFGSPGSLQPDLGKLGLFTLTTLLGVWAILATSQLTADSRGIGRHKRFVGALAGIAVGSAAWWLSRMLMVNLTVDQRSQQSFFETLGRQPLAAHHEPTWLAFCIFFGVLFAARRWWWHADPMRPALFKISSVLLTVAVAAVLPKIFLFPFDWSVTWAAVMSCVVQLSAGWIPPESRMRK